MKIVFVSIGTSYSDAYPYVNAGASVQIWMLARELSNKGHEIYIIRKGASKVIDHINLVGVNLFKIDARISFYSYLYHAVSLACKFIFSIKSAKIIKEINPDVVCLTDIFTGIFPSHLNVAKIYIMHNPDALDFFKPYSIYANKLNSIVFYVKRKLEHMIMRKVDKIVVLNSYIEQYLRMNTFKNVVRIPNGIDPEKFVGKDDKGYVLYAGRFDWNKNVCSLVNVFAQIHKSYPSYHLYLVGAGPEEKKIENLVSERGIQSHVKIIPWLPRNKLIKLMSRCLVFVLPSFFEVSPVVVLEAMASAKPVIARASMGTVDIIIHGENGYLYNNNEELREYLEKLLSDDNLREKVGRNARRVVEREYTFSKIADKYEELFYTLIKSYKDEA